MQLITVAALTVCYQQRRKIANTTVSIRDPKVPSDEYRSERLAPVKECQCKRESMSYLCSRFQPNFVFFQRVVEAWIAFARSVEENVSNLAMLQFFIHAMHRRYVLTVQDVQEIDNDIEFSETARRIYRSVSEQLHQTSSLPHE